MSRPGLWMSFLACCALLAPALSSSGDQRVEYRSCVEHCTYVGCAPKTNQIHQCYPAACPDVTNQLAPVSLQLTMWSCQDDCRYLCMMETERSKPTKAPEKYHGKWPFHRVLGMQEIMSVILSLANLAAHAHGIKDFSSALQSMERQTQMKARYPFKWVWCTYAMLHMNAWFWSAVFHSRDTYATERLDYCAADLVIVFSCAAAIIRIWDLRSLSSIGMVLFMSAAALGHHLHYMLAVKFDYGYNVQLCITLGVVQMLLWVGWCSSTRHPGRNKLYLFFACLYAAMALEVFDFPPVAGLLDAHAAWHACTVPLVALFYSFLKVDVHHCLQMQKLNS